MNNPPNLIGLQTKAFCKWVNKSRSRSVYYYLDAGQYRASLDTLCSAGRSITRNEASRFLKEMITIYRVQELKLNNAAFYIPNDTFDLLLDNIHRQITTKAR